MKADISGIRNGLIMMYDRRTRIAKIIINKILEFFAFGDEKLNIFKKGGED